MTTPSDLPDAGVVRPIVRWGADVMHRPARPVAEFDDALRALAADMVATMYAANGVGLAACQIGSDLALFVFDCPDAEGVEHRGVVCNPTLVLPEADGRHGRGSRRSLDEDDEGCLSLPGAFVPLARPDWARVEGVGLDGQQVSYEGDGLLARCLQHETDHLHGTVFGDRLSEKTRKRLFKIAGKVAVEFPADWPVSPRV